MECFAKIVNGKKSLILFKKTLHYRSLTGSKTHMRAFQTDEVEIVVLRNIATRIK